MRRLAAAFSLLVLGTLLFGCAYHLGPTNGLQAGAKSIQINPFTNDTLEPRLSASVTASLRKSLQQDGTFRLDTHDEGDIVVTGHITRFERSELSFQPRDIITPRDYRLYVTAQVKAVDRISGKTLLNRAVNGHTTIRVGNDLTSAERQAIPLLADDLARNATSLLVDGDF